jgi:DNA-binding NarL/FixJ family response regulator
LFVVKDSADGIRPLDGEDEVKGNPYLGDEEAEDIEAQEGTAAAENEALASSVLETSIIPHVCFFIDHEDHILVARAHTKENQGRSTRSSDIAELGAAVSNALSGENSTSPTESAPVQASQHFHRRLNRSRIHLGNT